MVIAELDTVNDAIRRSIGEHVALVLEHWTPVLEETIAKRITDALILNGVHGRHRVVEPAEVWVWRVQESAPAYVAYVESLESHSYVWLDDDEPATLAALVARLFHSGAHA